MATKQSAHKLNSLFDKYSPFTGHSLARKDMEKFNIVLHAKSSYNLIVRGIRVVSICGDHD
jgi:hypothetical protein